MELEELSSTWVKGLIGIVSLIYPVLDIYWQALESLVVRGESWVFLLYFFFLASLACIVFNSTIAELSVKYEWREI